MSKYVNQGATKMCMECDCGKSHTGSERTAKYWYKIHSKVCIQARRTLPIYNGTFKETDQQTVRRNIQGANAEQTLQIIETHNVK